MIQFDLTNNYVGTGLKPTNCTELPAGELQVGQVGTMECPFAQWGSAFQKYRSWNPKQPDFYGCFNWMIPNLYLGSGDQTSMKKTRCLGFQVALDKTAEFLYFEENVYHLIR